MINLEFRRVAVVACAGTYGHILLHVDELHSYEILDEMHKETFSQAVGWIRIRYIPYDQ